MSQHLAHVALLVREYDEALSWFRDVLGFDVVEDTRLSAEKRWILVAPAGSNETRILLARASGEAQLARVGDQGGGRVMFFLRTTDFTTDHARLLARGVRFVEEPRHEAYGSVAVFEDLYGNRWDLIGPRPT